MNEPTPSAAALMLLDMIRADYDHPWPNEDSDTKEHRERRLSQMNDLLTVATPAPSLTGEEVSDEAKQIVNYLSQYTEIHVFGTLDHQRKVDAIIQHALSTARAQDKADYQARMDIVVAEYNDEHKEVARLKAEVEESKKKHASDAQTLAEHLKVAHQWKELYDGMGTRFGNEMADYAAQQRLRADQLQAARDLAEQRVRELEERLRERDHQWMFGVSVVDFMLTSTHMMNTGELPLDTIRRWRSELHAARTASSCPTGTDLAAWVAQLAEDKRRLDWMENVTPNLEWDFLSSWPILRSGAEVVNRETLRSAIDASNPKTE